LIFHEIQQAEGELLCNTKGKVAAKHRFCSPNYAQNSIK